MGYISRSTAMTSLNKLSVTAIRILIIGACGLGIWQSWALARAGFLFDQDTETSVRAAIREVPDAWPYYMRLAQFDQPNARPLLNKALELNRYNAQADIELALQAEAGEDYDQAEHLMLAAFDVDRTYLPRWSLANFYLRRDNLPAFWYWARSAVAVPSQDISPLFDLCWRVAPDSKTIATILPDGNTETLRQFIDFLLGRNEVHQAGLLAQRLVVVGDESVDRPRILGVIDRLVADNDTSTAIALWRTSIQRQWVAADLAEPNNPSFARQPVTVSFDWNIPDYAGLHSWPGSSGLETEFSGEEPEDATIAEQVLALPPGTYNVSYSYRTAGMAPDTGIRWQMFDAKSGQILAESKDLSSETSTRTGFQVSVLKDVPFVRLILNYNRALGTPRIAGTLVIEWVQIEAQPQ
jgi:tetratricopeptide (TPR) repeat protein